MLHDSHVVSRFLTKPWEDERRRLAYVDIAAQRLRRRSSKSLLVKRQGLDTEMEELLSKYVETPVANLRQRWVDTGRRPEPRWPEFRAILLLLALQPARYLQLCRRPGRESGLDLLRGGEDVINRLAVQVADQYNLVTFADPGYRLFVPETGAFGFYIHDRGCATGCTIATGLPLHPQVLVALVSKSVTEDVLAWHGRNPGHIVGLTVGSATDLNRVVVPSEVLAGEGEDGTVRYVVSTHARNQKLLRDFERMRELAAQMYETCGLELIERRVGDPIQHVFTHETLVLR